MKKYKLFISGILILILGMTIGWMMKSPESGTHSSDESGHIEHDINKESEIWTCSMHPQIRQPEPGICPICEMDLIPLDNAAQDQDPTILKMSENAIKLAQIETTTVGGNNVNSSPGTNEGILVDGVVELDERTIYAQTAHIGGRIENMLVSFEGQYVQTGQKIATIYSTDLLAATEELITASNYDDRIEGLKDAAIQKLQNWKITDAQIQEILAEKKPLATIDLYADRSGYVLNKIKSQGDYIRQGETFYTTGQTGRLWIVFNVFESDLARIKTGQNVSFTTPSIPGKIFQSKVAYINPLLNNTKKTASVRAEINNSGNLLKPGMLAQGKIIPASTMHSGGSIDIPNSAILWTGEKSVVYVQLENEEIPTFQFREIEVKSRGERYSTISDGLEMGEKIVTHGAFAIDASAQLNNKFSMMNRNIGIRKKGDEQPVKDFSDNATHTFLEQIDAVVMAYLNLKNALVETNAKVGSEASAQMLIALENVDMSEVTGEGHQYWMEQYNAIKAHGKKIEQMSSDIEEQRNQFDFLSGAIISTLQAFGTNDKEYYVQYCPMAKDDQGANWLSEENAIRNPYFGDKMMTCGVVKHTLN